MQPISYRTSPLPSRLAVSAVATLVAAILAYVSWHYGGNATHTSSVTVAGLINLGAFVPLSIAAYLKYNQKPLLLQPTQTPPPPPLPPNSHSLLKSFRDRQSNLITLSDQLFDSLTAISAATCPDPLSTGAKAQANSLNEIITILKRRRDQILEDARTILQEPCMLDALTYESHYQGRQVDLLLENEIKLLEKFQAILRDTLPSFQAAISTLKDSSGLPTQLAAPLLKGWALNKAHDLLNKLVFDHPLFQTLEQNSSIVADLTELKRAICSFTTQAICNFFDASTSYRTQLLKSLSSEATLLTPTAAIAGNNLPNFHDFKDYLATHSSANTPASKLIKCMNEAAEISQKSENRLLMALFGLSVIAFILSAVPEFNPDEQLALTLTGSSFLAIQLLILAYDYHLSKREAPTTIERTLWVKFIDYMTTKPKPVENGPAQPPPAPPPQPAPLVQDPADQAFKTLKQDIEEASDKLIPGFEALSASLVGSKEDQNLKDFVQALQNIQERLLGPKQDPHVPAEPQALDRAFSTNLMKDALLLEQALPNREANEIERLAEKCRSIRENLTNYEQGLDKVQNEITELKGKDWSQERSDKIAKLERLIEPYNQEINKLEITLQKAQHDLAHAQAAGGRNIVSRNNPFRVPSTLPYDPATMVKKTADKFKQIQQAFNMPLGEIELPEGTQAAIKAAVWLYKDTPIGMILADRKIETLAAAVLYFVKNGIKEQLLSQLNAILRSILFDPTLEAAKEELSLKEEISTIQRAVPALLEGMIDRLLNSETNHRTAFAQNLNQVLEQIITNLEVMGANPNLTLQAFFNIFDAANGNGIIAPLCCHMKSAGF